ncbi:hypothetical protein CDL12_04023 [Handroanthus impetiginosus]|uniref:Uncharacterized protein n=1 Tax=Handroanthus impetiginosus TaxID=429701 RepID=A0A2G9I0H0_9LAMI|nr:hypothetical protein CDL12_04023 [Handroanthus impetiginosus]
MGEREKIAKQKAIRKFPQGLNVGEDIEFHGHGGSPDQEERVLFNDSAMKLMNRCSL